MLSPAAHKIQPTPLTGRRAAMRGPTVENASTRAAKARTATIWGTSRRTADGEVDQYRGTDRRTNAAESAHADLANRAEVRGLISTGS
jgi:hypothetical protein